MTDAPKWFTPEEALDKWCPFARSETRSAPAIPDVTCLGSDCMAWRWVRTHVKNEAGDDTVATTDQYGYCGLAGDPKLNI